MKNLLILGASGQIAQHVLARLANRDEIALTLLLRDQKKLSGIDVSNARVMVGNVLDKALLREALRDQEIVYANLTGEDIDRQARSIVEAMEAAGVARLIFVLSLGIYDEVPGKFGKWNNETIGEDLQPFRRAADAIEASGLDYTILRPAWLTDEHEVDYELTGRDEPFKGTVVSRQSVADLIVRVVEMPSLHVRENLGINKPNSDGEKPYFM
jgi:uncharacterized protein YbjT (DUF2867 family)